MRVMLNDGLVEQEPRRPRNQRWVIQTIDAKLYPPTGFTRYAPDDPPSKHLTVSPNIPEGAEAQLHFFDMLSAAYSAHRAIRIAPHDLWYIVLCEIAATINLFPEEFRFLFTDTQEKKLIAVQTATPDELPLDLIMDRLAHLVPSNTEIFLPEFSTLDDGARLAFKAAFADAVKSYYSYGTFCCGLPAVEFSGTLDDWNLFGASLNEIATLLKPCLDKLPAASANQDQRWVTSGYFYQILCRIEQIANLFEGGDDAFVRDIFTQKNVGSGGQLNINGWITEFYVAGSMGRADNLNQCLSIVPFINLNTKETFKLVAGSFWSEVEDGFRVARYGTYTFADAPVTVSQEVGAEA